MRNRFLQNPITELDLNPAVWRYEVQRYRAPTTPRQRILRIMGSVLWLAGLLLAGYIFATNGLQDDAGINWGDGVWRTIFFPMIFLQAIASIFAIGFATQVVSDDRRNQTWDNVRVTDAGAQLALRVRWAVIFFRLRFVLFLLGLGRLLLILIVLYELTAFRGGYLDLVTANIIPVIPFWLGIICLSLGMTALFLLPLTNLGLDIALGLLISVRSQKRSTILIWQFLLIATRLIAMIVPLLLFAVIYRGEIPVADGVLPDAINGLAFIAMSVFGDWGLHHAQFTTLSTIWALIPYAVFSGVVLTAVVWGQALLIDAIMSWTARSAEKYE